MLERAHPDSTKRTPDHIGARTLVRSSIQKLARPGTDDDSVGIWGLQRITARAPFFP
jgi:hypothetical protein